MNSIVFKRRQKLDNGDELVSVNYRGILFFKGETEKREFDLGTSNRILAKQRFLKIKKNLIPELISEEGVGNE